MTRVIMLLGHDFLEPIIDFRVHREASSLHNAGYSVIIYCWARRNDNLPKKINYNGIEVRRIKQPLIGGFIKQVIAFRKAMKKIGKFAIESKPDIIHAHDLETLPTAIRISKQCKGKVIFDSHEDWPLLEYVQCKVIGFWMAFQQLFWMPKANAVLTVSNELAKSFNGATVLYNSEQNNNIKSPNARNVRKEFKLKGIVVGYIGSLRFSIIKELFEAVQNISNIHLFVVGGPPSGQKSYEGLLPFLKHFITKYNINVTFTGYQSYDDMGSFYKACDILLVAHYTHELLRPYAVPKKLLDAMAYGVPVIVGPYTARRKIVEKYNCGIVTDNWREAILFLSNNPNLRRGFGNNGKNAFKKNFCWEAQEKKLLEVYSNM